MFIFRVIFGIITGLSGAACCIFSIIQFISSPSNLLPSIALFILGAIMLGLLSELGYLQKQIYKLETELEQLKKDE